MREIKFRGFAVAEMVNSQWLTGFGVYPIEFSKEYAKRTGRKKEMYLYTEDGTYQVQEKSIGQYTGLKDKNGVEIYEGDLTRDSQGLIGYVVYLIQAAGFVIVLKNSDYRLGHRNTGESYEIANNHEIIGNIYENPELING